MSALKDHATEIRHTLAGIHDAEGRLRDAQSAQLTATQDRDAARNLAERYQGERQQAEKDARAMPDNERLVEIARTRRERAQLAQEGANEADETLRRASQATAAADLALMHAKAEHEKATLLEQHAASLMEARAIAHPLAEAFVLLNRATGELQEHLARTAGRVARLRALGVPLGDPDALPVATALAEKLLDAGAGLHTDHELTKLRWAADHLLPGRPVAKLQEFLLELLRMAVTIEASWPHRQAVEAEVRAWDGLHSWAERQAHREAQRPAPKATGAATFTEQRVKR